MGANLGKGGVVKIIRERSGFSAQVITFVAIYSCIGARNPQLDRSWAKRSRQER